MTELLSLSSRVTMSAVCGLERQDENLFRSTGIYLTDEGPRHGRTSHPVYGGQVAAAALSAAGMTVDNRLPHSLHGYFLRPGRTDRAIGYRVERERDGSSYASRRVTAIQDDVAIFSMSASFHTQVPDNIQGGDGGLVDTGTHVRPEIPSPDDSEPLTVEPHIAVEARMCRRPTRQQYFPTLFWARPHRLDSSELLDHAAALTYLSDFSTGLPRTHGEFAVGASIDHALWLHRPFIWDDWVLVELTPGVIGHGRGHYTGIITDRAGFPVARFGQELVYRNTTPR